MGLKDRLRGIGPVLAAAFVAAWVGTGASSSEAAGEAVEFHVVQAVADLPRLAAYLEILDEEGDPVDNVSPGRLAVTVGPNPAGVVDVKSLEEAGEGVACVLLVDVSRSLGERTFGRVREALGAWIDAMTEKDRAAVMTFGTDVRLALDFTGDKGALEEAVAALSPSDDHTQLHLGLARAAELGRRADPGLPARRAVLVLSDGRDDFAGGMTKEEVKESMKVDPVPVYAVGFHDPPATSRKEEYLKVLGEFARTSGGAYFRGEEGSFSEIFSRVARRIRAGFAAALSCEDCRGDGRVYRLQATFSSGPRSLTDGIDVRLLPPPEAPSASETAPIPGDNASVPAASADNETDLGDRTGPDNRTEAPDNASGVPPDNETPSSSDNASEGQSREARDNATSGGRADDPADNATSLFASDPPAPEGPRWKLPGWGYAAGAAVLVLCAALLFSSRRRRTGKEASDEEAAPREEEASLPDLPPGAVSPEAETGPAIPRGLPVRLAVVRGDVRARPYEVDLTDRAVIGRSRAEADVAIPEDAEVSRRHCELILEDGMVFVRDLGSVNGTLVNGVPIAGKYRLETDDTLLVGGTELRIALPGR